LAAFGRAKKGKIKTRLTLQFGDNKTTKAINYFQIAASGDRGVAEV